MHEQPTEVFARPGRVKWFDSRKGSGSIEPAGPAWAVGDIEGADIGVHHSVIEGPGYRSLREGQAVRFDALLGDTGWKATRVERIAGGGPDDAGPSGVGAAPTRPPGLV